MERCRDFRRASIPSVVAFPRRRQRITSLRDSTDEDRQMELQETVRLRDRERLQKKDKDREFSKRRRVDRSAVQPRSGGGGETYRENGSTDASDEEYYEEAEETKIHHNKGMNQLSPTSSSLSNNRRGLRTLRSTPAIRFPADELFGVPVPRRARSVSAKRLQKCWISGMGAFGEDLSYRRFSPATVNLIGSGGASPFSFGASMKKKMKSTKPRIRVLSSASNSKPSVVQDDIEIEVAEALFDLMKQSQSSQIQEKVDCDSMETADGELKRLKAEGREDENNAFSVQNEQSKEANAATLAIDSTKDLRKENWDEKEKFLDDPAGELVGGVGFVNKGTLGSSKESESPSCVKVDACDIQYPTVTNAEHGLAVAEAREETKREIDLMASPPVASSPERFAMVDREIHPKVMNGAVDKKSETILEDGAMAVAIRLKKENNVGVLINASQLSDHDVEKPRNDFFRVGHCTTQPPQGQKEQKNQSTPLFPFPIGTSSWPGVLPDPPYMPPLQTVVPINGSLRPSMTMQFPQFKLSQPRPKRCATHQYLAQSIDSHLQLINKSLSSEQIDPIASRGLKSLNPMIPPTLKFAPGNLSLGDLQGGQNLGSGKDKPPQGQTNNILHSPGFTFPLAHHHPSMMALVNSPGPLQSAATAVGNASLMGNGAGKLPSANLSSPAVNYNSQNFPSNGITSYMTILNNSCPVPISTTTTMPYFRGGSPAMPFLNSTFYSSPVFNVHNKHQLSLPHPHNAATSIGSSSHKQPRCQQQSGDNKFPPPTQPNWPGYSSGESDAEFSRKNGSVSRWVKPNTQNGSFPVQSMNLAGIQGDHPQPGSKGRVEAFALSFGSIPSTNPAVDFSSMAQTPAIYHMLPDMAQTAQQKNFHLSKGRSLGSGDHFSKSDGTDISSSTLEGLTRTVNYIPSSISGNQQFQTCSTSAISNFQQQQLTGTGQPKALALTGSFLSAGFPSNSSDVSSFPTKWLNFPRSTAPEGSSQSAIRNIPQPRSAQGFANSSASTAAPLQGQQIIIRGQQEASSVNKAVPESGAPSQKSLPACRRNVQSILSVCPNQLSELKY